MKHCIIAAFVVLLTAIHAAPTPAILNHQGRIAVANVNHDGPGYFKFALVDAGATETFWTNDGSGRGAGGVKIEAIAIEFPYFLPNSGRKARFGRVEVTQP